MCDALVEPLTSATPTPAFNRVYVALYRCPDHGNMEQRARCVASGELLPAEATRIARSFVDLKNKRKEADYNPLSRHEISTVRNDIQMVDTILNDFWSLSGDVRIAFALHVTKLDRSG